MCVSVHPWWTHFECWWWQLLRWAPETDRRTTGCFKVQDKTKQKTKTKNHHTSWKIQNRLVHKLYVFVYLNGSVLWVICGPMTGHQLPQKTSNVISSQQYYVHTAFSSPNVMGGISLPILFIWPFLDDGPSKEEESIWEQTGNLYRWKDLEHLRPISGQEVSSKQLLEKALHTIDCM